MAENISFQCNCTCEVCKSGNHCGQWGFTDDGDTFFCGGVFVLDSTEQGHEADVPSFAEYEHHIDN